MRYHSAVAGSLVCLALAGCSQTEDQASREASYEDQQLCMNKAERAWARLTGSGGLFVGTDEYYRASKDCRDGRFSGPSEVLVRQALIERERRRAEEQRIREEQEQAARDQRDFEARERALDQEWDRIGCGDFDPQLTEAEERRCDELAGVTP